MGKFVLITRQFRVMILKGIECMRVGDNQGAVFIFLKLLIVMQGKFFEKPLLAYQSLGISVTFLQTTEDSKIQPKPVENTCQGFGCILAPLVIGKVITDIPKYLHRF